jgi:hypothetical protein
VTTVASDAPAFHLPPEWIPDTGERVVNVTLGLSAWLDDTPAWAAGGMVRALGDFLEIAPREALIAYTTTAMTRWQSVRPDEVDALVATHQQRAAEIARPEHYFGFRLADDPGAPSWGFRYTEIDPKRGTRAGLIEITLPQDADPGELFQLALKLANTHALCAMLGGYALRYNPRYKRLAFNRFYFWAKRYLGLDASDADEMAWIAPTALPGVQWLTLMSPALCAAKKFDLDALRATRWAHPVALLDTPAGVLVRAGEAPTPGDVNAMDFPWAMAEATRALAGAMVDPPPQFWGAFLDEADLTRRWQRRLIEPEGWT